MGVAKLNRLINPVAAGVADAVEGAAGRLARARSENPGAAGAAATAAARLGASISGTVVDLEVSPVSVRVLRFVTHVLFLHRGGACLPDGAAPTVRAGRCDGRSGVRDSLLTRPRGLHHNGGAFTVSGLDSLAPRIPHQPSQPQAVRVGFSRALTLLFLRTAPPVVPTSRSLRRRRCARSAWRTRSA